MDQEHSGDINIVSNFRWYNPAKLLSQLSEKDLIELMVGGERSTYPAVEAIRTCTKISRTMEEIVLRFEQGDLRPDEFEYHRPRSSRRRPPPTRANGQALREHRRHSDRVPDRRNRNSPRRAARLQRKASGGDPQGAIEGWQGRATGGLACHGVRYDGIRLHVKEGCYTACQHASPLDGGANQNYADTDHQ